MHQLGRLRLVVFAIVFNCRSAVRVSKALRGNSFSRMIAAVVMVAGVMFWLYTAVVGSIEYVMRFSRPSVERKIHFDALFTSELRLFFQVLYPRNDGLRGAGASARPVEHLGRPLGALLCVHRHHYCFGKGN